MSFLLDTNVVSEWARPAPDSGVVAWLAAVDEDRVFLSVVSLAELHYGVERLPKGRRRRRLDSWLRDDLIQRFEGRLLDVDAAVAESCGRIMAERDAAGRPIAVVDAFIAATSNVHGLDLVTRNERDFAASVTTVINPWSAA